MKKAILAYSGGLDTSVILKWLIDKGFIVVCFIADLGQDEDFKAAKDKALKIGASKVYIEDLKQEFVKDYIFTAIKANAVYEGKYLLGTALARPLIAKKQIEIAKKEKTNIVSHGATGKGNDQVRFELAYYTLMPNVEIIAPWKDENFLKQFKGRTDMINYAKKHNIPVEQTKAKPYSSDANLMHISYEAGVLEDPNYTPKDDMFKLTQSPKKSPDKETILTIEFKDGIPVKVNNITDPLKIFQYLNKIGGENGIGRTDLVENRFVGMKSRGVYETPAGTILIKSHLDIEGLTMDKEVKKIRDSLIPEFSHLIYNGFWFSPEFELVKTLMDKAQEHITGKIKLALYKGNIIIKGRESKHSLYDEKIASMDEHGGFNQKDSIGFIKLNALRLKASAKRLKK